MSSDRILPDRADWMTRVYNLCPRDEECERGADHEGPCGLKEVTS